MVLDLGKGVKGKMDQKRVHVKWRGRQLIIISTLVVMVFLSYTARFYPIFCGNAANVEYNKFYHDISAGNFMPNTIWLQVCFSNDDVPICYRAVARYQISLSYSKIQNEIRLLPDANVARKYRVINSIRLFHPRYCVRDQIEQTDKRHNWFHVGEAQYWASLGETSALLDEYIQARNYLLRAIDLDPLLWEAYSTLGQILLYHFGFANEAIREIKPITSCSDNPAVSVVVAHAYIALGSYGEAIDVLEKLGNHNAYSLAVLGEAYFAKGEIQQAVDSWIRSLTLDPCRLYLWFKLRDAYLKLGDQQSAEKALRAMHDQIYQCGE